MLNGCFCVFRAFLNGTTSPASSLADRWDIGDYIGSFVSGAQNTIKLQFSALNHSSRDGVDSFDDAVNLKTQTPSKQMSVYRLELTLSISEEQSRAAHSWLPLTVNA